MIISMHSMIIVTTIIIIITSGIIIIIISIIMIVHSLNSYQAVCDMTFLYNFGWHYLSNATCLIRLTEIAA